MNFSKITYVCTQLGVDFDSVELYAGYKQVYFTLPSTVIESLRDEDGELADKYEVFCADYGIWYDSTCECWAG